MATILLSAAGAAIGGSLGGTVLGLSLAAAGRFAGAVVGRSIDQRLLGTGSEPVEIGRVSRLRLTGTGEGDAIARVQGRMRVAGNVIWATEFVETRSVSGGGKGGPPKPKQVNFSYSVSLAIALCEGEISHVGRVWADGVELARDSLTMRVYPGSRDQLPDPRIEAVEGAGTVPAYRGTAYVVIEDMELAEFGNRVPQLSFEVIRPPQLHLPGAALDPAHSVRGVALLPGSGEYALATSEVTRGATFADGTAANVNTPAGKPDFLVALENLQGELPNCGTVSLIVSWFGDDLRCGDCTIRPKVEGDAQDGFGQPWQVAGLDRATAQKVPQADDGRPVYGGTPTDQSVIEAVEAMNAAGLEVMYYPFILMDQMAGNGLPDPWSDGADQPVLPWRGRITTSEAPGRAGSPDGSAAAAGEVDAFFGTASAADFALEMPGEDDTDPGEGGEDRPFDPFAFAGPVKTSPVTYSGPDEWGYRRFILHQAMLCKAAGGVESFCIGSEMRALTQIRGAMNGFPAVAHLVDLAAEVRAILGPDVKISYAADWSEYFGYQPRDGSGDRFFHLDPLWANDNIDFIGIDNYMPLSDWHDGEDHADAGWGAVDDLGYLMANIEGGEGYDWFYTTPEARAAQRRTPITDEAHDEPWVWRFKDIRNWWANPHHERIGGARTAEPTAWVPESKPIRFTEYGCPAVDKGTNQPNKFLDAKSSESALPHFSNGLQDILVQYQYLRAINGYWRDPANNPLSREYGAPMLDMDRACVWAWDARPYPFFPNNTALWSDGDNHVRGHWITGRVTGWRLASVVEEICAGAGLAQCDTDGLHGAVRGFLVEQVAEPRAALQPLALRYGFDAVDGGGALRFRPRDGLADHVIDPDRTVRDPEADGPVEELRGNRQELVARVRLRFVEAGADFGVIAEEAVFPDTEETAVSASEIPLAMTRAEGRQTVARWLSESRVATDTVRMTLPRSRLDVGAGDVIALPEAGGQGVFRVDRVELLAHAQKIEAVRTDPASYRPVPVDETRAPSHGFDAPAPVVPVFMDLPLMTGDEVPHAPHIAVTARPWPGSAAVYSSDEDTGYVLDRLLATRTPIGITESPLLPVPSGLFDRAAPLRVRMLTGGLESVGDGRLLAGANLCAIGDGSAEGWELMQFRDVELVDVDTYEIHHRLRGQAGTETPAIWPAGSYLVRLDGTPEQIGLSEAQLGLTRHYRVGPGDRPVSDPSYVHAALAFRGVGLRPLSPVHLRVDGAPEADLRLSWVRRTRIGGDRWDIPDVPLGEETERYLVRVAQGDTVLREETVSVPEWSYPAAAQAADGLAGAFELRVAQVSGLFGPGAVARLALVV